MSIIRELVQKQWLPMQWRPKQNDAFWKPLLVASSARPGLGAETQTWTAWAQHSSALS